MRLQLSFEMLVYFTLAGISILFATTMLVSKWAEINESLASYAINTFVSTINENAASGSSTFAVYIPKGVCNSTVIGNEVDTAYGRFYLLGNLRLSNGSLCPDGEYANLTVSYGSGETWVISK